MTNFRLLPHERLEAYQEARRLLAAVREARAAAAVTAEGRREAAERPESDPKSTLQEPTLQNQTPEPEKRSSSGVWIVESWIVESGAWNLERGGLERGI